jgi:hypothetical protein
MSDLPWQALYSAALSESDPVKLNGRIEAARHAIHQRLDHPDDFVNPRERSQLEDALHALFTLAARRRSA